MKSFEFQELNLIGTFPPLSHLKKTGSKAPFFTPMAIFLTKNHSRFS